MVWYGLNPTNSVVAPLEATNWGEPELAPHLRDARQFCLSVYVYLLYVLPYISIRSYKNGNFHSRQLQMT